LYNAEPNELISALEVNSQYFRSQLCRSFILGSWGQSTGNSVFLRNRRMSGTSFFEDLTCIQKKGTYILILLDMTVSKITHIDIILASRRWQNIVWLYYFFFDFVKKMSCAICGLFDNSRSHVVLELTHVVPDFICLGSVST
jgi:hypothetical protein